MNKIVYSIVFVCLVNLLNAQTEIKNDSVKPNFNHDSLFKQFNIYTELNFVVGGTFGAFSQQMLNGRKYLMAITPITTVGFFPTNQLLVGWTFRPTIFFSDKGIDCFQWKTGPVIRYYIMSISKVSKNWFSFYPYAKFYFGQAMPFIQLDQPYDQRFSTHAAVGLGLNFRLKGRFSLNVELGYIHNFFPPEYSNYRHWIDGGIGINYSFPVRRKKK